MTGVQSAISSVASKRRFDAFHLTPFQWGEILHALDNYKTPKYPGLSGLSRTLFRICKKGDPEVRRRYLGISIYLHGKTQNLGEAWSDIQQWMKDLGIDDDELLNQAIEAISTPLTPSQSDTFQREAPLTIFTTQSAKALERSAARFANKVPITAESIPSVKASELKLLESVFSRLCQRINACMDQWKARRRVKSMKQRSEILTKLRLLKIEKQIALKKSDTAYLEDLIDALKILFNRVLKIAHSSSFNLQDRSNFNVDLYKYPTDQRRLKRRKKRIRSEVGIDEAKLKNRTMGNTLEGMVEVQGKHTYYLLPLNDVGLFAKELRKVFLEDYDSKLDEMSIDLGVTEEQMLDLLNGWIQGEERIAQRAGVFLYVGRDRFVESFCTQRHGWRSIEEIPEEVRELVRLVRQGWIQVYCSSGFPGQVETIDGLKSAHLQDSPLLRLLANGTIDYSSPKLAHEFWNDVRQLLFEIDVNEDDDRFRSKASNKSEDLIRSAIEWKECWTPLDKIRKPVRGLVEKARLHAIRVFGCRLPYHFDRDDGKRIYLQNSPLNALLKYGIIKYSSPKTPHKYWRDVQQILFGIDGQNEDGKWVKVDAPEWVGDLIRSAIAWKQGWRYIKKISKDRRALVKAARQRVIDVFGGKLPPSGFKTTDGWQTGELADSPLNEFLKCGRIEHSSSKTADEFWREMRTIIFGVDVDEDGNWVRVDESPLAKALIRPVIEQIRQWTPLDKIPEYMHKLVEEVREQAIDVYGGTLPYIIKTNSGWRSGQIKDTSPLYDLLIRGKLDYTAPKPPHKLWPEIRQIFFGIGMNEDSKFMKVREPDWVRDLIRPVIEIKEGWTPIDEIPEELREIVRLAREMAIDIFGGHLPPSGIETTDGWKSGCLECCPFYAFLSRGTVRYTTRNIPPVFWKKCSELFFGLKLNKDGKYRRVPVPKKIAKKITQLEKQGMAAWDAMPGKNRIVSHPMFGEPKAFPFMALPAMGMSIVCP